MDLRDPWWGWYETATTHDGRPGAIGFLQARLFRRCVGRATLVVHNTERLRQLTCPAVPVLASKTRCIPNGCDSEWRADPDTPRPASFRIGYYGQVMGKRNPAAFLHGLRLWLDAPRTASPRASAFGSWAQGSMRSVVSCRLLGCVRSSSFVRPCPGGRWRARWRRTSCCSWSPTPSRCRCPARPTSTWPRARILALTGPRRRDRRPGRAPGGLRGR